MSELLHLFRRLASFSPDKGSLKDAAWDVYVDWAIGNGLAPLASYNLEYRLAGADAPDWARDRLLSIYQGSVNDNVMKLVNFKRAVGELDGRRILVLGGATFAEALYPHVAFRPVLEIQLALDEKDLDGFVGFMRESQFLPNEAMTRATGVTRALSDGRTPILLDAHPWGKGFDAEQAALFQRALPLRMYGPSMRRPALEDALLLTCLEHAHAGYEVPFISFVDLRELVLGAPSLAGAYSRLPDPGTLRARSDALRMDRALYASLSIVEALFPETHEAVARLKPTVKRTTQALLERAVIRPVTSLGTRGASKGAERLRRLLAGGRRVMRPLAS